MLVWLLTCGLMMAERVIDELRLEDKRLRALGALVDLGRLAVHERVRE